MVHSKKGARTRAQPESARRYIRKIPVRKGQSEVRHLPKPTGNKTVRRKSFITPLYETPVPIRHDPERVSYQTIQNETAHLFTHFSSNPLFLQALDSSVPHSCPHCPNKLWFLHSTNSAIFKWTRSRREFLGTIQEKRDVWKIPECFVQPYCSTEDSFLSMLNTLKKQYQSQQRRALRQRGIFAMECLHIRAQYPLEEDRNVSWENNSCAIDTCLGALPFILSYCLEFSLTRNFQSTLTLPGASVIAAQHCLSNLETEKEHKMISSIIRDIAMDISQFHYGQTPAFKW